MRLDDLLDFARDEYEKGYSRGLMAYAWWKDGEQFVGTTGTTLKTAIARFYRERNGLYPDRPFTDD